MDNKSQEIIEMGKAYLEVLKKQPQIPQLDYTENTLNNLQTLVSGLSEPSLEKSYKQQAMIGFAVYLGEMLMRKFPDFQFNVIFQGEDVQEIEVKNNKGMGISLLSWIRKCIEDPVSENVAGKYKATVNVINQENSN